MIVKIGNIYYFLYIIIAFTLLIGIYLFLKNKTVKFQYRFILTMCFLNLALHFLKLLFPPYIDDLPASIRKVTFENICAISTLLLPFVYLYKKNKLLNNYFFFIAFIGGLLALFYPTEAMGKYPFTFDVIRFYYCHISLFLIPCLTGMLKLYIPEYKKLYTIPGMFIMVETIILINEVILCKVGFVSSTITEFFSRECRNSSFVFGPLPSFDKIAKIVTVFVPKIFTENIFNIQGLTTLYWPVIWLVIPSYIYLPIIYIAIISPFAHKQMHNDLLVFMQRKKII